MEIDYSKICIINYADGVYLRAQQRLAESIDYFHPGIAKYFVNDLPPGCPTQNESPMAFKPFLLNEARKKGFDYVIWLDAVCVLVRPLNPIINILMHKGIYLWTLYANMGQWCGDSALIGIRFEREETFSIPELTTCVLGLSFRNTIGISFLDSWKKMAADGMTFRGMALNSRPWTDSRWNVDKCISNDNRVLGHRHDQTAASAIAEHFGAFRTCLYTFDVQQVIKSVTTRQDSEHVPIDAIILQNRDMKDGIGKDFRYHLFLAQRLCLKSYMASMRRIIKHLLFALKIKRIWDKRKR